MAEKTPAEQRARMLRLLAVVEHYERNSAIGKQMMRGTRYELAVNATDVNGDGCRFPACGCSAADCAGRGVYLTKEGGTHG